SGQKRVGRSTFSIARSSARAPGSRSISGRRRGRFADRRKCGHIALRSAGREALLRPQVIREDGMANSSKISRRNFMQQSALWAAAFAAGGAMAPRLASAAREKELNILCWEGYNSAQ